MTSTAMPNSRRGLALIAVLWIIATGAGVSLAAMGIARDAVRTATNRAALTASAWLAEGCVAVARASVDRALRESHTVEAWDTTDRIIVESLRSSSCAVTAVAVGSTIDVTRAGSDRVRRMLIESGVRPALADSISQGIADWQDPDDDTRELGAEEAWYREHELPAPPNRPVADARELAFIRGVTVLDVTTRGLLGVETRPAPLNHAAAAVLASIDGVPDGAAAAIEARRPGGLVFRDGASFVATMGVEPSKVSGVLASVVASPVGWDVDVRATVDGVTSTQRIRLVRAGPRAAIVRRIVAP